MDWNYSEYKLVFSGLREYARRSRHFDNKSQRMKYVLSGYSFIPSRVAPQENKMIEFIALVPANMLG